MDIVDEKAEKKAILDFIMLTWDQAGSRPQKQEIKAWVEMFFSAGVDNCHWLSEDVSRHVYTLCASITDNPRLSFYMAIVKACLRSVNNVNKDFNYEKQLSKSMIQCGRKWPWRLSPSKWYDLVDDYEEYDHIHGWDYKAVEYKGTQNDRIEYGRPFNERISLPYVMRNEITHNESRKSQLLGAIMIRGVLTKEHNNSLKMISDIDKVFAHINNTDQNGSTAPDLEYVEFFETVEKIIEAENNL